MRELGRPRDENGSALILALFVITLLTGMGTALLFSSQHEARMSRAALREKKAFYLAEAGLEHARMALFAAYPSGEFDAALVAAAAADGIEIDLAALAPVYDAAGTVTGFTGYGDDVPLASFRGLDDGDGRGWYAAFLTNDPGDEDGVGNTADDDGRVMITAIGAGEDRSVEVVQAIVEAQRFLPPAPAAAITMLGPLPAFYDDGDPGAPQHSGADCGVAGGAFAPIIGTVDDEAKAAVQASLNAPANFTAGEDPPFVGAETVANLMSLTDPIMAGQNVIDPMWHDCESLKQLVTDLAMRADHYCNADDGACGWPSTLALDTIVFVDGDLASTPGGSFTGTLVVTGELTWSGTTSWDGIVIAVGEGRVIRSGGGSGRPSGALVIANVDPSPNGPAPDRSDWCSAGVEGFEPAHYDTSSPGNATAQWCSSQIAAANPVRTYQVSQFLQR